MAGSYCAPDRKYNTNSCVIARDCDVATNGLRVSTSCSYAAAAPEAGCVLTTGEEGRKHSASVGLNRALGPSLLHSYSPALPENSVGQTRQGRMSSLSDE